ncbi:MAG: hypothetical protein WDN01_02215 [Rhizomicrobium sp.]
MAAKCPNLKACDLAVDHHMHHAAGLENPGERGPTPFRIGKMMQHALARYGVEFDAKLADTVKVERLERYSGQPGFGAARGSVPQTRFADVYRRNPGVGITHRP